MISVVIVCAGTSTRFNRSQNKTLLPLGPKRVFMHSVDKFLAYTDDVIVVCNHNDYLEFKAIYPHVVLGGNTRQASVLAGVMLAKNEKILIHDGARPLVTNAEIEKMVNTDARLAYLGIEVFNTLKMKENHSPVERSLYVEALTPQLVYKKDYLKASQTDVIYTDDVSLVSNELNLPITMLSGAKQNFKITTFEDYELALSLLGDWRVGHSWDVHRLVNNRKLILGGVTLPFEKGLLGHSDADALLHAISEALLGSLALGDLGSHFPDNDPKYLGMDSQEILKKCYQLVKNKGYRLANLDAMIYAEAPKMQPYILSMRKVIANLLAVSIDKISIKATTYEKMDAIGRNEAIAAEAYCLVCK